MSIDPRQVFDQVIPPPGWTMEVYETPVQGTFIRFKLTVEDSYNPGVMIPLDIKSPLPPFETYWQAMNWLRWRMETIAVHEIHEGLRWKEGGKPVWDPHEESATEPRGLR